MRSGYSFPVHFVQPCHRLLEPDFGSVQPRSRARVLCVCGEESADRSLAMAMEAAVAATASVAAYRWKLSKLRAHRAQTIQKILRHGAHPVPRSWRRPRLEWPDRHNDEEGRGDRRVVDDELTDRLLIDRRRHSHPRSFSPSCSPSLPLGLLKCAPRMNGANSGQRWKREKCEQSKESRDRYFISKVKLSSRTTTPLPL